MASSYNDAYYFKASEFESACEVTSSTFCKFKENSKKSKR